MKLLIATAALMCAPLPALAQTAWPAAIVAGAQAMPLQIRMLAPTARDPAGTQRAQAPVATADMPATRPALKMRPSLSLDPDETPAVEIPAKAEWTDDQGLQMAGARLAYKKRF